MRAASPLTRGLLWWALCCNAVYADQNAPALTALFDDLQNAPRPVAAYTAEQAIWGLWMEGPTARATDDLRAAQAAVQAGQLDDASRLFERLTQEFPRFSEVWNQRAIMHFLAGDFRRSLADIEQTLALEPRHFGALAGRGECYLRLAEPEQALKAYESALAIHPYLDDVKAKVEQLRALYQRGA